MAAISEKKAIELLGNEPIPGTAEQRQKLYIRIGELVVLNGEVWVHQNRDDLLQEWEIIIRQGYLD
jgi:hypothetical protein